MLNTSDIASKLLIIESDTESQNQLKQFCQEYNLKGVIVPGQDQVQTALECNLNIGAIIIPHLKLCTNELLAELLEHFQEIPIFIGSSDGDRPQWKVPETTIIDYYADIDSLKECLSQYIYNLLYPEGMIEKLKEMSIEAINSQFRNIKVVTGHTYLSSDKRIYGERIELMPVRSNWCDGIMMLQSKGTGIESYITAEHTAFNPDKSTVSAYAENLLRELINQIWGSFKAKFTPDGFIGRENHVEVPMTINHLEKYISFGIRKPLLCFKFIIEDEEGHLDSIPLYLKFSFHLYWNTDEYTENEEDDDAGGLELF